MKNFIAKTIVILTIFGLCVLGFWQLSRMKEKNDLIDILNQRLYMEVIKTSNIEQDMLYRKIEICGNFIPNIDIFVYSSPNYLLLAPFKIENSKDIIMIARGRVNQHSNLEMLNHTIKEVDRKCIRGILIKSEKQTQFMPEMDGSSKKPFLSINTNSISKIIGLNLSDAYIAQTDNIDELSQNNIEAMNIKNPDQIYNNHLEYALTWFMLAAILFLMFASTLRKGRDNKQ